MGKELPLVEHIPIGSAVFYFDPVRTGKLEIKQSYVFGVFMHKSEGELYYFIEEKECPAYAISSTMEECDEKLKAFDEYRTKLVRATEENQERFRALRKEVIVPEYAIEARVQTEE